MNHIVYVAFQRRPLVFDYRRHLWRLAAADSVVNEDGEFVWELPRTSKLCEKRKYSLAADLRFTAIVKCFATSFEEAADNRNVGLREVFEKALHDGEDGRGLNQSELYQLGGILSGVQRRSELLLTSS